MEWRSFIVDFLYMSKAIKVFIHQQSYLCKANSFSLYAAVAHFVQRWSSSDEIIESRGSNSRIIYRKNKRLTFSLALTNSPVSIASSTWDRSLWSASAYCLCRFSKCTSAGSLLLRSRIFPAFTNCGVIWSIFSAVSTIASMVFLLLHGPQVAT